MRETGRSTSARPERPGGDKPEQSPRRVGATTFFDDRRSGGGCGALEDALPLVPGPRGGSGWVTLLVLLALCPESARPLLRYRGGSSTQSLSFPLADSYPIEAVLVLASPDETGLCQGA